MSAQHSTSYVPGGYRLVAGHCRNGYALMWYHNRMGRNFTRIVYPNQPGFAYARRRLRKLAGE